MLKIYITPEIQDKRKPFAGTFNVGLQIANNYKPLSFSIKGENTITSFKIISLDNAGNELEQITLPTNIIKIDTINKLYYVDGGTLFENILCDGIYYFLFLDGVNEFKSEVFKVEQEEEFFTSDNNYITCDNNYITADETKITI